jgi:hypothetical protein
MEQVRIQVFTDALSTFASDMRLDVHDHVGRIEGIEQTTKGDRPRLSRLENARRSCDSRHRQVGGIPGELSGKFGGLTVTVRFGAFAVDSERHQLTHDGEWCAIHRRV